MSHRRLLAALRSSPLWCSNSSNLSISSSQPELLTGLDIWWFRRHCGLAEGLLSVENYAELYLKRVVPDCLSPSMGFDEEWYRLRYPQVNEAIAKGRYRSGWEHYLLEGFKNQHNAAPWFDEAWYQAKYAEVGQAVKCGSLLCGFEHYLLYGIQQDFSPSIYFHPAWYRRSFMAKPAPVNAPPPIAHYLVSRRDSVVSPAPFFDANWYRQQYFGADVDCGTRPTATPFRHYLLHGRALSYSPSPNFNEAAYRAAYPQVADKLAAGDYLSGFEHYVFEGVLEGLIAPTHLETAGIDYSRPEFLQNYEHSVRTNFKQLALLRELLANFD